PGWAHGLPLGLAIGSLARGRRGPEPPQENVWLVFVVLLGIAFGWMASTRGWPLTRSAALVLTGAVLLVWWTWRQLLRAAIELAVEPLLWLIYKIRGRGPGLTNFPRTGPCLVIANHACWFDPLFMAKVLPRPLTPMMTARFYDLPFIRRLMPIFGVVRVP